MRTGRGGRSTVMVCRSSGRPSGPIAQSTGGVPEAVRTAPRSARHAAPRVTPRGSRAIRGAYGNVGGARGGPGDAPQRKTPLKHEASTGRRGERCEVGETLSPTCYSTGRSGVLECSVENSTRLHWLLQSAITPNWAIIWERLHGSRAGRPDRRIQKIPARSPTSAPPGGAIRSLETGRSRAPRGRRRGPQRGSSWVVSCRDRHGPSGRVPPPRPRHPARA